MRGTDERGAGSVEYAAALALAAAIIGSMFATGVTGRLARACEAAVCRLFGDCQRSQVPGPGPAAFGPTTSVPPRPPLLASCEAGPEVAFTEGLHSHNDYQNRLPLDDALAAGATSLEADIWLQDGELTLRHSRQERPAAHREGPPRTLRDTYVNPLSELGAGNGGHIYGGRPAPIQLIIEIKDRGDEINRQTFDKALQQVAGLPKYGVNVVFASLPSGVKERDLPPGVSLIVTPTAECGLPDEVVPGKPGYNEKYARNVSLVNASWQACHDPDPVRMREKMTALATATHARGWKIRFVQGPDGKARDPRRDGLFNGCAKGDDCSAKARQEWWRMQLAAGVDYLDTQQLGPGRNWLRNCGKD